MLTPPRSTPFPTRRSSDLALDNPGTITVGSATGLTLNKNNTTYTNSGLINLTGGGLAIGERKSTRPNSGHITITYAVCWTQTKTNATFNYTSGGKVNGNVT